MNEIEAIKILSGRIKENSEFIVFGEDEEIMEHTHQENKMYDLAIQALREKRERDEGCKYCDFSSGDIGVTFDSEDEFFLMKVEDGEYMLCSDGGTVFRETKVYFCPNCGRKLGGGEG